MKYKLQLLCLLSMLLLIGLPGCNPAAPADSTPAQSGATDVSPATVVATDVPAATPTPTSTPGRVLLLASAEADPQRVAEMQAVLAELAAQDSLLFEIRQALQPGDLGNDVRLVVVLAPDPGIRDLVVAKPAIQFLAVGIPGLTAGQNLSLIAPYGERVDRQGFLAGYIAAVITADWRVGVISRSDAPAGLAARQAFINGAVFFCGLCRPAYPPFTQYPVFADLSEGAGQTEQQAAADALIASAVETVYVFPGAGDLSLLQYLASAGLNLIGGLPVPSELQSRWVAAIGFDWTSALRQVWPELIAGQGGGSIEPVMSIESVNEDLFSTGRLNLVKKIKADLEADYIDTGVDPLTGEAR